MRDHVASSGEGESPSVTARCRAADRGRPAGERSRRGSSQGTRDAAMDTRGESRGGMLRREVDFGPALALLSRRRVEVILGLGVLFRVVQYLAGRSYWMDESSLGGNITRERVVDV